MCIRVFAHIMGSVGEFVFNHAILHFIIEHCCESQLPWGRFERRHVNRGAMLRLLSTLAAISSTTWLTTKATTEFAALRLALLDMEDAALELSSSRKTKTILRQFDSNLELFTKSWELEVEVPAKLKINPLGALSATELHELRRILKSGWQQEIKVLAGNVGAMSPKCWVTPAMR